MSRAVQVSAGTRHRRRRMPAGVIALNLAPMIDVVFLLLIYFMLSMNFTAQERAIATTVMQESASDVSPDPFALPEQPIMIIVRSTGDEVSAYRVSTDSPALGAIQNFDALVVALEAARSVLEPDQRFVIAPDAATRWEHTVGAVAAVRRSGFNRVRMAPPAEAVLP